MAALHSRQAQREERGGALIDARVHLEIRTGEQRQVERRVARAWANDNVSTVARELRGDGLRQLNGFGLCGLVHSSPV